MRGVWATYSDTSWEFRSAYVSIELRLAAYFWFKFRALPTQPSSASRSGCKRARGEKGTPSVSYREKREKFEPRLKDLQTTKKAVWLFDYDTYQEAADAYWIGAFYYNQLNRFSDEVLEWCKANLPSIPLDLCPPSKESWVRAQVRHYLTPSHSGGGIVVEQFQAAEYVAPVFSGEEGSLPPIDDIVGRSSSALREETEHMLQVIMNGDVDQANASIGFLDHLQHDYNQEISVDDYNQETTVDGYNQEITAVDRSREGEVSRLGVESEGLNFSRTYGGESAFHQQSVGHLQQSHESAIVSEGQGNNVAEGGALRQNETEDHSALRASADGIQAVVNPIAALKINEKRLVMTDAIRSTLRQLHHEGVNFIIRPRVSTEFSIAFLERLQLTAFNIFAFEEIHKQGFEIIPESISHASPQVTSLMPFLAQHATFSMKCY